MALCAIYEVETGGGVRCSNGLAQEDAVADATIAEAIVETTIMMVDVDAAVATNIR